MTSAGLESIALAVAHLERVNEGQAAAHRQNLMEASPSPSPETEVAPVPPAAPPGSSFATTARIVSAEVFPEQQSASSAGANDTASAAPASTCYYPRPPSHDVPSNNNNNNNNSLTSTNTSVPASWVVQPTITNHPTGEVAFSNGALPPASWNAPAVVPSVCQEEPSSHFNKAPQAQPVALPLTTSTVEIRHRNSGNPGNLKDLQPHFAPADFATAECPPVPSASEPLEVGPDDVIFGRGGSSNHHSGNIQYRQLVKACQHAYLAAKRRDKPRIAAGIVLAVRKVGGRFLKKDADNMAWRDVGNNRAREKTSQALREGAPELRDGATSRTTRTLAPSEITTTSQAGNMGNILVKKSFTRMLPKSRGRPKKTEKKGTKRSTPVVVPNMMNAALGWGNLAENCDAMIPQPPNSKKQRRPSALENLAVAATLKPMPETQVESHNGFGVTPAAAPSVVPQAAAVATLQCVPTVSSGDDDDGSSSSYDHRETVSKPALPNRGPRIKLLKQRLQSSDE